MDVIKDMYDRWARGEGLEGDAWGDVTAEPGGVDYREVDADGVPALWIEPHAAAAGPAIVAYHGGGFVGGSLATHRKLVGHLARAANVRALLAHYRLAPDHPYPAQIEDALTAYEWVRAQGVDPLALAGDSSGGGLCVQVALRLRDAGRPGPVALLLMSPWNDLEPVDASFPPTDVYFTRPLVEGLVKAYLQHGESVRDPRVNAHYADLTGLPPLYVQVGADESGLDDSRRLAAAARAAGVDVRLDVFAGQLHTFQMAAGRSAVADDAIERFAAWLRPKLSR